MTDVSNLTESQSERFSRIVDTWARLIDENRETISLSDTNLDTALLLEQDDIPRGELKYRRHFDPFFQPDFTTRCGNPQQPIFPLFPCSPTL